MKTNRNLRSILTGFGLALLPSILPVNVVLAGAAPSHKMSTGYTTIGGIVTPLWLSHDRGLFQKYGLDVTLKYISSGPVIVSAVLAGDIEITTAGRNSSSAAYSKGAILPSWDLLPRPRRSCCMASRASFVSNNSRGESQRSRGSRRAARTCSKSDFAKPGWSP